MPGSPRCSPVGYGCRGAADRTHWPSVRFRVFLIIAGAALPTQALCRFSVPHTESSQGSIRARARTGAAGAAGPDGRNGPGCPGTSAGFGQFAALALAEEGLLGDD